MYKAKSNLPAKFDPDRSREEITLAEFPVTTMARHAGTVYTRVIRELVAYDEAGKPIYRQWKMTGTKEYGLPIAGDEEIFGGLCKMLEHYDFKQSRIPCTRYQLCKIVGIAPTKARYQRVADAFHRFTGTSFHAKNVSKDPETKALIRDEAFSIIAAFKFVDRVPAQKNGRRQSELPLSYFEVPKAFLEKLDRGKLKPLDFAFWRSLPKPLTKRLYRFLDKNRYQKTCYEIGLLKLALRLGLSDSNPEKEIKRLITPSLRTLRERGFLNDWKFEPAQQGYKVVVYFNPTYHRNTRKKSQRQVEPTLQAGLLSEKRITPSTTSSDTNTAAEKLVRHWRQVRGFPTDGPVTPADRRNMVALLNQCDGDLEQARYAVEFACKQWQGQTGMETTSGVLQSSYPQRARQEYDNQKQDNATAQRAAAGRDAQLRAEEQQSQELDRAWLELPEQERAALLEDAEAWLISTTPSAKNWKAEVRRDTAVIRAKQQLAKRLGHQS